MKKSLYTGLCALSVLHAGIMLGMEGAPVAQPDQINQGDASSVSSKDDINEKNKPTEELESPSDSIPDIPKAPYAVSASVTKFKQSSSLQEEIENHKNRDEQKKQDNASSSTITPPPLPEPPLTQTNNDNNLSPVPDDLLSLLKSSGKDIDNDKGDANKKDVDNKSEPSSLRSSQEDDGDEDDDKKGDQPLNLSSPQPVTLADFTQHNDDDNDKKDEDDRSGHSSLRDSQNEDDNNDDVKSKGKQPLNLSSSKTLTFEEFKENSEDEDADDKDSLPFNVLGDEHKLEKKDTEDEIHEDDAEGSSDSVIRKPEEKRSSTNLPFSFNSDEDEGDTNSQASDEDLESALKNITAVTEHTNQTTQATLAIVKGTQTGINNLQQTIQNSTQTIATQIEQYNEDIKNTAKKSVALQQQINTLRASARNNLNAYQTLQQQHSALQTNQQRLAGNLNNTQNQLQTILDEQAALKKIPYLQLLNFINPMKIPASWYKLNHPLTAGSAALIAHGIDATLFGTEPSDDIKRTLARTLCSSFIATGMGSIWTKNHDKYRGYVYCPLFIGVDYGSRYLYNVIKARYFHEPLEQDDSDTPADDNANDTSVDTNNDAHTDTTMTKHSVMNLDNALACLAWTAKMYITLELSDRITGKWF